MRREMRSCRSRRACSTFVSASVGGSQAKSSASGGKRHKEMESGRRELPPAPNGHSPSNPRLTCAVQGHVAGVAAGLTGSDANKMRSPPSCGRLKTEVTLRGAPGRFCSQTGACCCTFDPDLEAQLSPIDHNEVPGNALVLGCGFSLAADRVALWSEKYRIPWGVVFPHRWSRRQEGPWLNKSPQ